jgi:hypothetical protein
MQFHAGEKRLDSPLRCVTPTILQGDYKITLIVRQASEIIMLFLLMRRPG